ncbi:MAG: hypothetical protein MJE68_09980, partial [Proteobacteria bacterium]|nr:hypothetical protein [Pseudomonadota bacterium]
MVKIDLNELEKYGRKGLKYDRVEPEYIPVEQDTLKRINHMSSHKEKEYVAEVIDDEQISDIAEKRELHLKDGTLQDFELEKYECDWKEEMNVTIVEENVLSMRPVAEGKEVPVGGGAYNMYRCGVCGSDFNGIKAIKEHKKNRCTKKYPCMGCDVVMETQKGLFTHISNVHGVEVHACDKCGEAFKMDEERKDH